MIVVEGARLGSLGIQGPLARLRGSYPSSGIFGLDQEGPVERVKKIPQEIIDKVKGVLEGFGIYLIMAGGLIGVAGSIWLEGSPFQSLAITVGGFLLALGLVPLIGQLV